MVAGNQVLPEAPAGDLEYRRPGRAWRGAGRSRDRMPGPGDGERGGGPSRRGSGGRWLVWPLRVAAWAVLLLIGFRGVIAIVAGPAPPAAPAAGPARQPGARFPVMLAQAYALQFGQAYLNFSPATSGQRARELAGFLPAGADPQLGWNGAGTQRLQSEQVASVAVHSAHAAVITLLAAVSGKLIELGVPLYASGAGLVVSGEPALLPAPATIAAPQLTPAAGDAAAESALTRQLAPFFQAYASGDQVTLGRFLATGAHVTGLAGAVAFHSISQLTVPAGGGVRNITATVVWQLPAQPAAAGMPPVNASSAQLEMTYAMTVVRQHGSWYVQSIGAAPNQPPPS